MQNKNKTKQVWLCFTCPGYDPVYVKNYGDFITYVSAHDSPAAHLWGVKVVLKEPSLLQQVSPTAYKEI